MKEREEGGGREGGRKNIMRKEERERREGGRKGRKQFSSELKDVPPLN